MTHPYGKMLHTVELGGLSLTSESFDVAQIEGWDAGAGVRASYDDLPSDHGAYGTTAYYGPKNMTIEGTIWGTTEGELQAVKEDFLSRTADLSMKKLVVTEPWLGLSRQCMVRRSGDPTFVRGGYSHLAFTLPVIAPDPRRYSADELSVPLRLAQTETTGFGFPLIFPFGFSGDEGGGDISVDNIGNVYTWPTFVVRGPITDPIIRNNTTGEEIALSINLLDGEFVTMDTRQRTVLLAGTASRRSAVVAGSRWPKLVPGNNLIQFRGLSAVLPEMTIRYRSAWA